MYNQCQEKNEVFGWRQYSPRAQNAKPLRAVHVHSHNCGNARGANASLNYTGRSQRFGKSDGFCAPCIIPYFLTAAPYIHSPPPMRQHSQTQTSGLPCERSLPCPTEASPLHQHATLHFSIRMRLVHDMLLSISVSLLDMNLVRCLPTCSRRKTSSSCSCDAFVLINRQCGRSGARRPILPVFGRGGVRNGP